MVTALVMSAHGCTDKAGSLPPGPVRMRGSGRLLLAQGVHELDQLDGAVPVLGGGGFETLLLTVGETVEGGLVPGRRIGAGFCDRRLQVIGQVRVVGIGTVDDRRRLVDDAEVLL